MLQSSENKIHRFSLLTSTFLAAIICSRLFWILLFPKLEDIKVWERQSWSFIFAFITITCFLIGYRLFSARTFIIFWGSISSITTCLVSLYFSQIFSNYYFSGDYNIDDFLRRIVVSFGGSVFISAFIIGGIAGITHFITWLLSKQKSFR